MSGERGCGTVVSQQPDGRWRWRWVQYDSEGNEDQVLVSHTAFDSASEAEQSARSAYPDVPVQVPSEPPTTTRRPHRRRLLLLAGVAVTAALITRRRSRRRSP